MNKWGRVILTVAFLAGFSIIGTNCGKEQFQTIDGTGAFSSMLPESAISGNPITEENSRKNTTPYALLSAQQVLNSMQQVTDTPTLSNSQNNEFNNRSGTLAAGNELELVNGPMLIAISSFAGEMCNGMVTREAGVAANMRKFFPQVDFTKGPSALSQQAFSDSIQRMARSFWGRDQQSVELDLLNTFKSEFMQTLTAQQAGQAAATRSLLLGACTGMLASFDTYTY